MKRYDYRTKYKGKDRAQLLKMKDKAQGFHAAAILTDDTATLDKWSRELSYINHLLSKLPE